MIMDNFSEHHLINICKRFIKYAYNIDDLYPLCDNAYEYAVRIKSLLEKMWNENPTFSKTVKSKRKYIQYRQLTQKTRLAMAVNVVIPENFRNIYWNAMWYRNASYDLNYNVNMQYIFDGFPGSEDLMAWTIIQREGSSYDYFLWFQKKVVMTTTTKTAKWIVSNRFKDIVKPKIPSSTYKSKCVAKEASFVSDSVSTRFLKDRIDMLNALSYSDAI